MQIDVVQQPERVKVLVECQKCGQKYLLRGTPKPNGEIETGFKMCLCDSTGVKISVVE